MVVSFLIKLFRLLSSQIVRSVIRAAINVIGVRVIFVCENSRKSFTVEGEMLVKGKPITVGLHSFYRWTLSMKVIGGEDSLESWTIVQ